MRRIISLAVVSALALPAIDGQTFFSVNAGTDGFNFNVTNVPPLFPAVVVAPRRQSLFACLYARGWIITRWFRPKIIKRLQSVIARRCGMLRLQ